VLVTMITDQANQIRIRGRAWEALMKTKVGLLILAVAVVFFVVGRTTAQSHALNQKTLDNLSTAMHGEAFAYAKYLLYAEHARQAGNKDIAALFEKAAKVERFQHFAEEAQLAGLVGSDADNLRDAVKGESYEVDTMYLGFAREAAAVEDKAAADRFEEVRQDEMGHRDAFKAALKVVESKAGGN
jgi:rubrerythrin